MKDSIFRLLQLLSKTYFNNNQCNTPLEQKYKQRMSDLLNSPRLLKKNCQNNEDILLGINEIFDELNIVSRAFQNICPTAKMNSTTEILNELKECLSDVKSSNKTISLNSFTKKRISSSSNFLSPEISSKCKINFSKSRYPDKNKLYGFFSLL